MSNPFLDAQRAKYEGHRERIRTVQQTAVDEDRNLTETELELIRSESEQAKGRAEQIEELTEHENRNARVAELAASLAVDPRDEPQTRGTSTTQAKDRDPGHYRSESEGGQHSFFADLYRSRSFGDQDAATRLVEHQRALSTSSNGAGVIPPNWLTSEFEELARQGRRAANAVRNIPLGDDPRPLTLPKQTAHTSVADQTAENSTIPESDAYDTDVDTVSPAATAGKQTVSRQMLDMSSPAIDQLIYGDLVGAYNAQVEGKVCAKVMAAGPTALAAEENGTGTTTPIDVTSDTHFANVTIDAAIDVRSARKLPANVALMSVGRWGKFKKLRDLDGRPLIPTNTGQAVNVSGIGSVNVDGVYEDLAIIASDGVSDAATFAVLRTQDVLLFESNMLRFRYEEPKGPESVILGIWGYVATLVRQSGDGVQRVTVSDAA